MALVEESEKETPTQEIIGLQRQAAALYMSARFRRGALDAKPEGVVMAQRYAVKVWEEARELYVAEFGGDE